MNSFLYVKFERNIRRVSGDIGWAIESKNLELRGEMSHLKYRGGI